MVTSCQERVFFNDATILHHQKTEIIICFPALVVPYDTNTTTMMKDIRYEVVAETLKAWDIGHSHGKGEFEDKLSSLMIQKYVRHREFDNVLKNNTNLVW